MAKACMIEREKKRVRLAKKYAAKRAEHDAIIKDKNTSPQERLARVLKRGKLPRNSSNTRQRNRCALTGRPRGYFRKLNLSRIALRELASQGKLPGVVKSSW